MIDDLLKSVPLFSNFDDNDFGRISGIMKIVHLKAGERLFEEGDAGDRAYIISDGQLEIIKNASGREVLLSVRGAGDIIGEMSLLEQAPRMASVRARTDCILLEISQKQFDKMLTSSPSAMRAMLDTVLSRWRENSGLLQQSEKLAQLGTLTAGIAHELNNPAAAVQRGADHLQEAINDLQHIQIRVFQKGFSEAQWTQLQQFANEQREQAVQAPEMDALQRSDREYALETWLEEHGVEEAWECAPVLVNMQYDVDTLKELTQNFTDDQLPVVVDWLSVTYSVNSLLYEIGQGSAQISEIIKALKSYVYLDRGPVQSVNLNEGLNNTLIILKSKLKTGITVHREFEADLPNIEGYGGELNQVWTNIIDNAAYALNGHGEITIRTFSDGHWAVVQIQDNGPGIPEEIQSKVFDPFFTTKPQGEGTGMGLDICYNIVVMKHRGEIRLVSEPGRTCFEIRIPFEFEKEIDTQG